MFCLFLSLLPSSTTCVHHSESHLVPVESFVCTSWRSAKAEISTVQSLGAGREPHIWICAGPLDFDVTHCSIQPHTHTLIGNMCIVCILYNIWEKQRVRAMAMDSHTLHVRSPIAESQRTIIPHTTDGHIYRDQLSICQRRPHTATYFPKALDCAV